MIPLPDFKKAFSHENDFYLSCDSQRIGKLLAHYELFKLSAKVSGDIIECGVFKGASFARFATFRTFFGLEDSKKMIGFDTFGKFPTTQFKKDVKPLQNFIGAAGNESISPSQLRKVLRHKKVDKNIELVKGDIVKTVPDFVKKNPKLKISMLNLDTDIYEPAVTILEYLYPRLSKGGVLIIDNYNAFPGETQAVKDYFKGNKKFKPIRFSYTPSPYYFIKS
jgi:hypothetical protein